MIIKDMNNKITKCIISISEQIILIDQILSSANEKASAVYLYLREITGMNTKQIVTQLNKFRKKYKLFKTDWDNVNI